MSILWKRNCLVLLIAALVCAGPALAQKPEGGEGQAAEKPDEGEKKKKPEKEDKIKPYDEVITEKTVSDPGLFLVHREDDDVYFEIPVDEFGKDMVWVTQIAETQAGYSWAGMPVGDRVVRWEQRGDRVLLRDVKYDIRADVDDPIKMAVQSTSVSPIIHVFDVVAYGKDKSPVIKVSSFFTSDKSEFTAKEMLDAKGLDSKRTFVEQVKSFPENIETKFWRPTISKKAGMTSRGAVSRAPPAGTRPRAA